MCEYKKEMMKRKFCDLVDNLDFNAVHDLVSLLEEAAEEIVING